MGRFSTGEIYEGTFPSGNRQAEVLETSDAGRRARLSFIDNGEPIPEVGWMELHQAGKWRKVG